MRKLLIAIGALAIIPMMFLFNVAMTNYTDGVSSYGIPLIGSGPILTTGDVYFVRSTVGSDGYAGTNERPFATLDFALSKCTANNDDVIILKAGHSETITGAGGITVDKAGVRIVGLGRYDARPTFLMDGADTVTALFTAANASIENCIFKAGHADIAIWGLVTAKGVRIKDCVFVENTSGENWVDCIHAGAADYDYDGLEIINCEMIMDDAACVTAIDLLKNCLDVKIIGNRITGDFDASPYAPIYMATAEVPTNILIKDNLIYNKHDGNAAVGISVTATTATGWITKNHVQHIDVDGSTPVLGGSGGLYCGENYVSSVAGTASGYLYPAADDGAS